MAKIRVIAIATETATKVLETMRSPGYGHPAYTEIATGHGPCRYCLKPFSIGQERRTLFTYDPFYRLAPIPSPGPIFIHADGCERFDERANYPAELTRYPVVLDGYDAEQIVVSRRTVSNGQQRAALEEILGNNAVRYVMVRDLEAGCFDFRVERLREE